MSSSTLKTRTALLAGGTALLVGLPALPAFAVAPPTDATAASHVVGDRFVNLSWTDGDGTGAIVRDVTGLATPHTPTQGRGVPITSATSAHDTGFTNTGTATYAIWSTASDGTPSANPLVATVASVAVVPTTLTLQTSRTQLPVGVPVTIAGQLNRSVSGGPVPSANQPVNLYGVDGGSTTKVLLRHLTTDANGRIRTTLAPKRSLSLTLKFAGDSFSAASTSAARVFRIVPRNAATLSPTTVKQREVATVAGRVTPGYVNARVLLQEYYSHAWHSLAATHTASAGAYAFRVAPPVGAHVYRTVLTATPAYLASGTTPLTLTVTARDLTRGMQGADVLALQKRLAALHYQPGALNGTFGADTQHAVYTFQKVERLARTGTWAKGERARVAHPTILKVRFPSSGTAVEVDVTRQVLVLSRGGVVQRIMDVSTGGEYRYTDQGVSYVAHTPRGAFTIQHKIDGVRTSRLGYLYRPSYFFQGYAIHGESYDVPTHPASHGCVRVTNYNADILFPILVVGTPVHVFDE